MSEEEAKQWLRSQIDSSIEILVNKNVFYLCYNNSYLRALKLSKITGNPVNKEEFNSGEGLIRFNTKHKTFSYYSIIRNYLKDHYSKDFCDNSKLIEEVLDEYDEYKNYFGFNYE